VTEGFHLRIRRRQNAPAFASQLKARVEMQLAKPQVFAALALREILEFRFVGGAVIRFGDKSS